MEKLLNMEINRLWEEEAHDLGFLPARCDEYADYILKLYSGGPADEEATFIAHLIWAGGDNILEPWQTYAIWNHLEKVEDSKK